MALLLPSTDSLSDSESPPSFQEPVERESSKVLPTKIVPIDPFATPNVTSWETWTHVLGPRPPRPSSISLPVPPKVDLFSETPLSFEPRPGPIDLSRVSSETSTIEDGETRHNSTGHINLFDGNPYQVQFEETIKETTPAIEEEDVPMEGGIWATTEPEEFEFDWPSDEIKQACEALFANEQESILPALNWIPEEQKIIVDPDEMQDVQEHG